MAQRFKLLVRSSRLADLIGMGAIYTTQRKSCRSFLEDVSLLSELLTSLVANGVLGDKSDQGAMDYS